MLLEIHMVKSYPPTNLNRDDSGAPKTCVFGGVTRGRISSQCLKRSWRTSPQFQREIGQENLGIRTRHLPKLVAEELERRGIGTEYIEAILPKLSGFGNKEGKENTKGNYTAQIIFYAPEDICAVADRVQAKLEENPDLKEVKKWKAKELQAEIQDAKVRPITLDIALFGRMVTSDAFADVEASMQVAHAISTNRVVLESDYFTAMDDLLEGDSLEQMGSGMIGDTDYDSCCYYTYASLDTDALYENLKFVPEREILMQKVIPALLRVIALSNPSGKQNSFAGHMLPSAMLIVCKEEKIPVSLANAFIQPVQASAKGDLVQQSIEKLVQEQDMIQRDFGLSIAKQLWFCVDKYEVAPESDTIICKTFSDLVDETAKMLK